MDNLSQIFNLLFHLYMIFLVVYSGLAIFALLRFGQSRLLNFVISSFYIALIGSLYFQTLAKIHSL